MQIKTRKLKVMKIEEGCDCFYLIKIRNPNCMKGVGRL